MWNKIIFLISDVERVKQCACTLFPSRGAKKVAMRRGILAFTLVFSLVWTNLVFAVTSSTSYIIFADAFTAGGTEDSSSTLYGLQDSIGEGIISSTTNATSTSATYGIKSGFRELYPDQSLTFSIADASIDLGTLTDSTTGSDSNTMIIATNATNGFTITASGSTITSGSDTIDAIGGTAAASTVGTEQFGINLVDNATPDIGADPAGTAPIGSAADQYNVADLFAFNSGDTVATSSAAISATTLTVSYIGNITATTEAGTYATTITYAATGNF